MCSQVIAVAKSSDIVLMVLDASKVSVVLHFLVQSFSLYVVSISS